MPSLGHERQSHHVDSKDQAPFAPASLLPFQCGRTSPRQFHKILGSLLPTRHSQVEVDGSLGHFETCLRSVPQGIQRRGMDLGRAGAGFLGWAWFRWGACQHCALRLESSVEKGEAAVPFRNRMQTGSHSGSEATSTIPPAHLDEIEAGRDVWVRGRQVHPTESMAILVT